MGIGSDLARVKGNLTAALSAIADKGVTVPDGSTSNNLAELIAQISSGGMVLPNFVSEINFGSFTKANYTESRNVKVEHGLSGKPKGFVVWADSTPDADKLSLVFGINITYYNNSGAIYNGITFFTRRTTINNSFTHIPDETYIYTYNTAHNYGVHIGVTYNWIAWR